MCKKSNGNKHKQYTKIVNDHITLRGSQFLNNVFCKIFVFEPLLNVYAFISKHWVINSLSAAHLNPLSAAHLGLD